MSAGRYTPGPWFSREQFGYYDVFGCSREKGRSRHVLSVFIGGDESRANVRLIEAAPDLVEALSGLCKHRPPAGVHPLIDAAYMAADAALAKALGGAS